MDVIYIKIAQNKSRYGQHLLTKSKLVTYGGQTGDFNPASPDTTTGKPSRMKVRLCVDGILLHYILNELVCCPGYRNRFVDRFYNGISNANVISFDLIPAGVEIIDYNWNYRITYLVRERCELEHALSWLSTLGGAFSALGDYFSNFAKVAGKISYHQLLLALRIGDPGIVSRCKLYFSLSLIQQHHFKKARKIIEGEYAAAKDAVVVDARLVKMCLGIWSKLQYEYRIFKETRRYARLKLD